MSIQSAAKWMRIGKFSVYLSIAFRAEDVQKTQTLSLSQRLLEKLASKAPPDLCIVISVWVFAKVVAWRRELNDELKMNEEKASQFSIEITLEPELEGFLVSFYRNDFIQLDFIASSSGFFISTHLEAMNLLNRSNFLIELISKLNEWKKQTKPIKSTANFVDYITCSNSKLAS